MTDPHISVVTICFNNLAELKLTCQHLDAQLQLPYEHWIIDGSKNDEIKNWIRNSPQPSYRHSIHEPDRGISDAFNKGVQHSKGDIIHIHNSGDYYYNECVLRHVTAAFKENIGAKWLHGKYAQYRGGIWLVSGNSYERTKLYRGMRTIGHPTMFVYKDLYTKYGLFLEDKKIAMDYDFLVRIANEPFVFLNEPLVYFTPGGVSEQRIEPGLKEVAESYRKHIGISIKQQLWHTRIKLLHSIMKSPPGNIIVQIKNRNRKINIPD
ncbi:MAG: glycosyltransferase [Bacteroidota bacterium]|nr:glycosyltransferase [Bacteroidota bacterium]